MAKTKLTDKLCDEICNDIKAGVPIKHAAISHGITEVTFYNWYNQGKTAKSGAKKQFYDKVEEAKSVAITLRARRIYKAGETNWQADAWWLERVDPENFGRKDYHKHEADINNKSQVTLSGEITTKQVLDENEDTIREFINRTTNTDD